MPKVKYVPTAKICPICGMSFETKSKTCSVLCGRRMILLSRKSKPSVKKTPNKSIVDIQREAEKHHMTYGQYVAMYGG